MSEKSVSEKSESESGSETSSTCKAQEIYDSIHIDTTENILEKINDILHDKIPELSLEFNTYEEMTKGKEMSNFDIYDKSKKPALLLCLLENGKCISSISCKINPEDNAIEISSKTNKEYEGKKYNLFLRCAIVLIITHLMYGDGTYFEKIISRAVNPISIYSMIAHFEATTSNEKLIEYTNEKRIDLKDLTLEQAKDFYDKLREIPPDLEDEDDIMEYCEREIEPYDPVIMEIDINQDPDFIEKYMKKIGETDIKKPPEESRGGKKTKRRKTKKGKKTRRRRKK